MKLSRIYENPIVKNFPNKGVQTQESISVYGELKFPEFPEDRTYTMASFVTSIDGKVAFPDNTYGPIVARGNALDREGADADYWIMTLLRANADAVICGAGSMKEDCETEKSKKNGDEDLSIVSDRALENERIKRGLIPVPWGIICSLDGSDIKFNNRSFMKNDYIIATSPVGLEEIKKNFKRDYFIIGSYKSVEQIQKDKVIKDFNENKYKKVPVIITGEGNKTDTNTLLRLLKLVGINTASCESPSFCHSLMEAQLLDEITLNYSCVYIGGNATSFGNRMKPFTSLNHPHTEMLTIHTHSSSFFYFRHMLVYGLRPEI